MEILGYIASFLIGISLGLIGGGGSILTVPVMVYLFGLQPLVAMSYSLFIVGSTSIVGAVSNYRKGLVNVKAAIFFGSSSIATVFLVRKYIVPALPNTILKIGRFPITSSFILMLLFAVLMLLASVSMIRKPKQRFKEKENQSSVHFFGFIGYGILIGLITGLLGAGGGFLLIPTLVFLIGLSMKKAIGTSLLIIALNSLIGFLGDLGHVSINWVFLLEITGIAIAGILIGGAFSKKIKSENLKKGFGWFVLAMGVFIIVKEIFAS